MIAIQGQVTVTAVGEHEIDLTQEVTLQDSSGNSHVMTKAELLEALLAAIESGQVIFQP